MKHHNTIRKLGRIRNQRKALLQGLAIALVENARVRTTEAKAKELRPFIEKLVTRGRKGDLAAIRLIASRLSNNKDAAKKIVREISPKYAARDGGYTRIIKLPPRPGDASKMAYIEFV